jgi:hypoxanthine-DNA glycosylase
MKKDSFQPIVNEMTETIILGTMPGEISLQKNEYCANRSNQFWKIIFRIFNNGNEIIDYQKKNN